MLGDNEVQILAKEAEEFSLQLRQLNFRFSE